jgi:hypothetical protein
MLIACRGSAPARRWQAYIPVVPLVPQVATYLLRAVHSVQDSSRRDLSRGRKLGRIPRRLPHRFVDRVWPPGGRLATVFGGCTTGPPSGRWRREGEGSVSHSGAVALWARPTSRCPSVPPRTRLHSSSRLGRNGGKPGAHSARDRGSAAGVCSRGGTAPRMRQAGVVGSQRWGCKGRMRVPRISASSQERPSRSAPSRKRNTPGAPPPHLSQLPRITRDRASAGDRGRGRPPRHQRLRPPRLSDP